MKNKHYTLMGALTCLAAFVLAFAPLPEEVIRMTIMHQENGHVTVYDTLVDVSGGYTIEQYIASKGLDPRDTEIIHTNNEPSRIATSGEENKEIEIHMSNAMVLENVDIVDGEEQTSTITKWIDANGNLTIEKKVNGQVVEFDGDMNENFSVLIEESLTLIEETIDIELSNESETGAMVYSYRTINDDGDEDEEVRVKKVMYASNSSGGDNQKEYEFSYNILTTNGASEPLIITPSNLTGTRTVAIVTKEDKTPARADDDPDSGVSGLNDNLELPIEDLNFFPNPSDGHLTLQFFLPHRGQSEISVYDLAGKEVYTTSLGNFQGRYSEQLNFTNLEKGMYIMRISQNNLSLAEKLIIK